MARGKQDSSPVILPVLYAALIVGHAHGGGKNAHFNKLWFLPVTGLVIHHVLFTATDVASSDHILGGVVFGVIFMASDHILLRNRQPEIRKIGQTKSTSEMSFWERLKTSTDYVLSFRGIGFSSQPTHRIRLVPPNLTRTRFITSGLAWMCFYALLYDVTSAIQHAFPMYHTGGPSFTECGWLWRASIWAHIFGVSAGMSMTYTMASIVTVALRIYSPQDWPPYFGYLSDAYTVRNCWGRVWHQMMRKLVTTNGNALADILSLPKNTFRTYFKLYVAFFISGVIHLAGDYMLYQRIAGRSLQFFLLQAVAINFEDAVIGISRRLGVATSSRFTRIVGYLWVFIWFVCSVPYWVEPNLHVGTLDASTPDISFVHYLWTGNWKVAKGVSA